MTDANVPKASLIRSNILSFLPTEEVIEASNVNENWFNAASHWVTWRSKFNAIPQVAETLTGGEEYHFPTPKMYELLIKLFPSGGAPDSFDKSLEEAEFYNHIGQVIGLATARYTQLFPILHVYLRHPKVHAMAVDKPVREGYIAAPRYFMILANITRWHFVDPRAEDIPWLLSLNDWVISTPIKFHKLMLASATYIVTSPKAAEIVSEEQIYTLMRSMKHIADNHLGDKKDQTSLTDKPQALPDEDPRLLFSIFYYIQKHFSGMKPAVDEFVLEHFGDFGKQELESAAQRVEYLIASEAEAEKERKKKIHEQINKYREENGIPPLPEKDQ